MFRAPSCPSSGAQQLQQQPLVYRWNVVVAVLLVVVGIPEAATAVVGLLMMGMRVPETCRAVFKRQVINLRNCCIRLVDSFEGTHNIIIYAEYVNLWGQSINTISFTSPL
jgi:hypothetical protein